MPIRHESRDDEKVNMFAILSHPQVYSLPPSALLCTWDTDQTALLRIPCPLAFH